MQGGLKAKMDAHRALIEEALQGALLDLRPDRLRDATRWYPEAGGKRLRPVMAMLACEAAGGRGADALPVAIAVELVHNFSLVHDDIMDQDETRRGRASVHAKWDEATAILAGDVLFARAFEVLTRIEDPRAHREAARALSGAVHQLCVGQAMDIDFETRDDVTIPEYLEMIHLKTAVLFEAAMRGGALMGAHPSAVEVDALARFGAEFGVAFQVADDILDVTADAKTMGKPWGSDIRAGKRTVLVLDALANADAKQRERLTGILGDADASGSDVRDAVDILRATGALQRGEALRDARAALARKALDDVPDSDAKRALIELNAWATGRGF